MAANQIGTVMHTDNHPADQPNGTLRFALNNINQTVDGNHSRSSNELSNEQVTTLPEGFELIGNLYIQNNEFCVWLHGSESDQIGIIHSDNSYEVLIDINMGFKSNHQIDSTFRIRNGERVVYFVDGLNNPRLINLDSLSDYYTPTYKNWIISNIGGTFPGIKWNVEALNLFKTNHSIPAFVDVKILSYGKITSGSYNFAIQYLDSDLNPTQWINVSNTVNVFVDSTTLPYNKVRGSKNIQTTAQNFSPASKSIQLVLSNLDTSFPYYRIGIIQATSLNGKPTRVLLSSYTPTQQSVFVYSGDDENLQTTPLTDVLIDGADIVSPKHIEQVENRLILANGRNKVYNWCDFQASASKIRTDFISKQTILTSAEDFTNPKNENSTFFFQGYMPGQPISIGIVYLMDDYSYSPVFHIPGPAPTSNSLIKSYQLDDRYFNSHDCASNNYWGTDCDGNTLNGSKIRHHRIPFRSEVNKPLLTAVNTSISINRYQLTFDVNLVTTYPVDLSGQPITINYTMNYRLTGIPSILTFNGTFIQSDLGTIITIYDDLTPPVDISPGVHVELDPTCQLAYYVNNGTFTFNNTTIGYQSKTVENATTSEIFGISLSNIQKPSDKVLGFYIVRNAMEEGDKYVIDNAIVGNVAKYNQYRSFAQFVPEKLDVDKDDKTVYAFSPSHQFLGLQQQVKNIRTEGYYEQTADLAPIKVTKFTSGTVALITKSIIIQDAQPGTTYNPTYNKKKNKDGDGFDLMVGYTFKGFTFHLDASRQLPVPSQTMFMPATGYQLHDSINYYNTSCDNKISMISFETAFDKSWFRGQNEAVSQENTKYPNSIDYKYNKNHSLPYPSYKYRMFYTALLSNTQSAYRNFLNRPYYKEHNNVILFGQQAVLDDIELYNGDAFIAPMNLVSMVYFDTYFGDFGKKNKTWQIIAGVVLIVVGAILLYYTGGSSAYVIAAGIALLAISYGISLVVSGIKFEQMKNMIDIDYPAGLKECVVDGGTWVCVNSGTGDDAFIWQQEMLQNIYIESYVNVALRVGLTSGVNDFFNSPTNYTPVEAIYTTDAKFLVDPTFVALTNYATEKLTVLDREQQAGRLYKGYPSAEYYDANPDFMRKNREKEFFHLPVAYDCCTDIDERYGNRVWWSQQSFQEEQSDNFRVFLPNNYRDIEGEYGTITNLFRRGSNLMVHTKDALWELPASYQERITDEIVSFLGTGDFFSIPTRKVVEGSTGGSSDKWATVLTMNGTVYVSEKESVVYLLGEGIKPIIEGRVNWFKENLKDFLAEQFYYATGKVFPNSANPATKNCIGIHAGYDKKYNRVIITKRDYLIREQFLSDFKVVDSVIGYSTHTQQVLFYQPRLIFDLQTNQFGLVQHYLGRDYFHAFIDLDNTHYFDNKSWTTSYSFDDKGWTSMHSYIPGMYLVHNNTFNSIKPSGYAIYKHHKQGSHQKFYDVQYPYFVEYVSKTDGSDILWESIAITSDSRIWDAIRGQYMDTKSVTFNSINAYTSNQATGEIEIRLKDNEEDDYLIQQTIEEDGYALADRILTQWRINNLRNNIVDYTKPLFSSLSTDIAADYYIDKVVTPGVISFDKDWTQTENLKGTYLIIRLGFNNFDNINLTTQFSEEDKQQVIP